MKTFDPDETFDTSLTDFVIETVPRYIEKRGYIYILQDTAFPLHLKIGRTSDMVKRLRNYNEPKPFPTASLLCISKFFDDVIFIETKILEYLYKHIEPTTFRKEWFEIEHKELLIKTVQEAEKRFS